MSNGFKKIYSGNSVGPNATVDDAVKNALSAAATAENTNHFLWTLITLRGDVGGTVGKTITAEVVVYT
jgi:hypothetical protein